MDATEKETEIARKYLAGELTEVQMNYLAHQCGSTMERIEAIAENMATMTPIVRATKLMLFCIMFHFMACTLYAIASFVRG